MIEKKRKKAAVIGIGRVGLPLALVLADSGFEVFGIGKNPDKCALINEGKMPFMEEGAEKILKKVANKNFLATTDYSYIKKTEFIILTLGTPIDSNMNPVLSQIESALMEMKPFLKKGQTLILRSTVSPGTTQYVKSIVNKIKGLSIGKNFYLAFCPERIVEGHAIDEIRIIPQIIGGVDASSTKKAEKLFKLIGSTTLESDDISAELAKLFTNMYRYINFAIANEFMVLADNHGKNIYSIIDLVNSRYKRGGLASPGMTAGPCLFKDGFFLVSDLPYNDLITTSWKINESIPLFLVKKLKDMMRLEGKTVLVMGVAFKAEIDDIRESLSFKVRKALLREHMDVILHDPYVKDYAYQEIKHNLYEAAKGADLLFVATNHREYKSLDVKKLKKFANKDCMVCDIWNVFGTGNIFFPLKDLGRKK